MTAGAAWYLIWRKGRQVKGLEEQHGVMLSGPGLSASAVWMFALVLFAFADLLIVVIAVTDRPQGWLSEVKPTSDAANFWWLLGIWFALLTWRLSQRRRS